VFAPTSPGIPRVYAKTLGSVAYHSTAGKTTGSLLGNGKRCLLSRENKFSFLTTQTKLINLNRTNGIVTKIRETEFLNKETNCAYSSERHTSISVFLQDGRVIASPLSFD